MRNTSIVFFRLCVVPGLQWRWLSAAGSRSSTSLQPRFPGIRTQLQAKDLPQHLPEHRQILLKPAEPRRQHGGMQVQPGSQDKQTQAQLGSQHRRIQVQPGSSHETTQAELCSQYGWLPAKSRAQHGETRPEVQPQHRQTFLTQTEPNLLRRQAAFNVVES